MRSTPCYHTAGNPPLNPTMQEDEAIAGAGASAVVRGEMDGNSLITARLNFVAEAA
eukprot:CAMPEP_0178702860 /NCGR_PEP_ID=MMETSP0699-20121125/13163_1 /TAXON_ID=265572 /ORGANISM="Extubocellulus spinifer, Strain CCMP396" /LENGTH=55 /DNA_ID=CAMNT_0020349751 /DNA_START=128 /DNA_END=292 /DNA_ORIENTATION=+